MDYFQATCVGSTSAATGSYRAQCERVTLTSAKILLLTQVDWSGMTVWHSEGAGLTPAELQQFTYLPKGLQMIINRR